MAQPPLRSVASGFLRASRPRALAGAALIGGVLALPGTAWAQCSPASGSPVTCSGTSGSYTNTGSNVAVTVNAGATVEAPLVISGSGGTLTVQAASGSTAAGTITGAGAYADVQYGSGATVTNNGVISSTGSSSGSAAISVGDNSTVTNNGSLAAVAATPAVEFGVNGTYIQTSSATAATTGNIVFGTTNFYDTGTEVGKFTNNDTTYGLSGNVISYGNVNVSNNGLWTGSLVEYDQSGITTATVDNSSAATFTGTISTGAATTLTNEGTMTLYNGSIIDSGHFGTSSFTNAGTLTIGATSAPALVSVYGSFTQKAGATLNLVIDSSTGTPTAGTDYSQIHATGSTGTATLAGTINLSVSPGFYATNSVYQLVLADQGITNNGVTLTGGSTLPFVTFTSLGVVTVSGTQQAYEVEATHTADYAASLASTLAAAGVSPATTNELRTAAGLNTLIPLATATPSGAEAAFLGYVDVQNYTDARTFLDSVSPQGYYAYAEALRDQSNTFARQVNLRLQDQNSQHDEDGWWGSIVGQRHFGKETGYNSGENLYGLNLGYDYSGPHHVYGLAFSASWDSVHYAPNTLTGHNRDLAFDAYAGVTRGPIHVTGQLQYNLGHLGATKTIVFNNSTGSPTDFTATAKAGEHLFKATSQIGLQLKAGKILFEPFVGIDYMNGKINAFTETSTLTAAQLSVNPISANRTDLLAGVSLTRSRGVFRPYLRVEYRSRVGGPASGAVSAYFDGQSTAPFTVYANEQAKHEIDTNAGINWVFDDAGSLFIGYQNTLRNGLHSHGVNLGVRIEF